MIQITEIVNSIFTSKTYILSKPGEGKAWLVDIGDVEPVVTFVKDNNLTVAGVFLTHAHFDHIYGLPELVKCYSRCMVYVTEYAKAAMASDKLNMSKYHEMPVTYEGKNVIVVHEGDEMVLFDDEPNMHFYETPGHNQGCLTMVLGDKIFTGDAYIPGIGVNTQVRHSDKKMAKRSMERILDLSFGKNIYPGHHI